MAALQFANNFPLQFSTLFGETSGGIDRAYSNDGSEAVWEYSAGNYSYKMIVTGTDLDTTDGTIQDIKIVLHNSTLDETKLSLEGIAADFAPFKEGIDTGDWSKIAQALNGIDLTSLDNSGPRRKDDVFQGFGGDDNIQFKEYSGHQNGDYVFFDGGNDTISLGKGDDYAFAATLAYTPGYDSINWVVDGGEGYDKLVLSANYTSFLGYPMTFVPTGGVDIALGEKSDFLTGSATFYNFEAVDGTAFGDTLTGENNDNQLAGFDGDDHLNGLGGTDRLDGGNGDDRLDGGAGADVMIGGAGDDIMFLRNAGDTASGGDDDDTVYAYINVNTHNVDTVETIILMGSKTLSAATGSWDDVIQGNDGDNIIRGGAGVDKLNGAGGNDRLFGGEGSDQLIGGKGKDELYGGERGDTFLLNSVAGSTTKASGRDTIHDFSHKEGDMIDLHLMDANTNIGGHQGLDFIGSQAFHRIAGELRYSISGNTTILFGDVDGDGKSDFALEFDGKIKFQDSDFSL